MGAYRNPGMIQGSKAGEIYGQAIASFGASIASGIQQYYAAIEKNAKEQRAENKRIQEIGYKIEEAAWDNANANRKIVQDKSPSLIDQYNDQVKILLDGQGVPGEEGYVMGAIEAQTKLATADLTKEEKQDLRKIVNRAKIFQDNAVSGTGNLLSDFQDQSGIKPGDVGNTHYYVGNNTYDQVTSQYSSYALQNKEIPGAQVSKTLLSDDDGNPIVNVKTVFDVNTAQGKEILKKFPEFQDKVKDGKITFEWQRDINQLGDGFIREIPTSIDVNKTWQESNALDEQGNLTKPMIVGDTQYTRKGTGAAGVDELITAQYINIQGLQQDVTFNAKAQASAEAMVAADMGDLRAYMKHQLNVGPNYDFKEFMSKPADEKVEILKTLELERLIRKKVGNYEVREATQKDVDFFNANAQPLQEGGPQPRLNIGDPVYLLEKSKTVAARETSTTAQRRATADAFVVLNNMTKWANENRANLNNDLKTADMWNEFLDGTNIRIQEAADGGYHFIDLKGRKGLEEVGIVKNLTDTDEMIRKIARFNKINEADVVRFSEQIELPIINE